MSGRRPRMLVRRPWSASGVLCAAWAAGCRVVRRRGSECERRYVGMAVPEGGVGGLCAGRGGLVGCRGGGPESLTVLRTSTLCREGDKVVLAQLRGLSSSAMLECPVSAPPIVGTASSLQFGWMAS
jgi:hypothetical protein